MSDQMYNDIVMDHFLYYNHPALCILPEDKKEGGSKAKVDRSGDRVSEIAIQ